MYHVCTVKYRGVILLCNLLLQPNELTQRQYIFIYKFLKQLKPVSDCWTFMLLL